VPLYQLAPLTRKNLVWETRFVMVAFLLPGVMGAVLLFVEHVAGVGPVTQFPSYIKNPVGNLIVGILAYLPVASTVPLALFLLYRSGQSPKALGLGFPSFRRDIWPGLGLAAAAFGSEVVLLIPLAPLLAHNASLFNRLTTGRVPSYYVIWGIAIALTTAITEEVLVNGYLLTRLEQLGWSPKNALVLSLALRTSYHVYYGLGFILTIPFGYLVTRSFQKHRRLNRPIAAHFLFDAFLFTLAVLK
jgi:membrane protease YdiL (CAAX protease family)